MNHAEAFQYFGDIGRRNLFVFAQPINIRPKTGAADIEKAAGFNDVIAARRLGIKIQPVAKLNQGGVDLIVL